MGDDDGIIAVHHPQVVVSRLRGEDPDLVAAPTNIGSRRRGRPKEDCAATSRAFLALVIVCAVGVTSDRLGQRSYDRSEAFATGVASCRWELLGGDDDKKLSIGYYVDNYTCLLEWIPCSDIALPRGSFKASDFQETLRSLPLVSGTSCWDVMDTGEKAGTIAQLLLSDSEAADLQCGETTGALIREAQVPLHGEMRMADLITDCPTRYELDKLRQQIRSTRANASCDGSTKVEEKRRKAVCYLPFHARRKLEDAVHDNTDGRPRKLLKKFDPVRLLQAVAFSRHLRNQKNFQESLEDAARYDRAVSDDEAEVRDTFKDPSGFTLYRAKERLDAVAMLIDQREFAGLMQEDRIAGINLFSDSSPVVGEDLQGMIMHIVFRKGHDPKMIKRTLPGSSLPYGFTGWTNKVMALVWAVYLTIGPNLDTQNYFWRKVRSVTTDYGTELSTNLVSNMIPAFLQWVTSGCKLPVASLSHLVDKSRRLMGRSLRIGGWNHSFGHIMEGACRCFKDWPDKLTSIRVLARTFRNHTYRRHMAKVIPLEGIQRLLKNFTAGFAKWRFETLHDVLEQLSPLRELCEVHVNRAVFNSVQDDAEMTCFVTACKNKPLWRFICFAYRYLLHPLELMRRWGLLCSCCAEERRRARSEGKKFKFRDCDGNGRRLREVADFIAERNKSLLQEASNLTSSHVEEDEELLLGLVNALRWAAAEFVTRVKYLLSIPWRFCVADTPEGARECLKQYAEVGRGEHDDLTNEIMDEFGPAIKDVAAGLPPTVALLEEAESISTATLDESAGEGYHRATNAEQVRAPGSLTPFRLQSVRLLENIRLCRSFIRKYGHDGRLIIRYEWRNYKRMLKVRGKRRWRCVKMGRNKFFSRLYRRDHTVEVDWSPLISRPGQVQMPVVVKESWHEEMAREYLSSVFQPLQYYKIEETKQVLSETGDPVSERKIVLFQVLKMTGGKKRGTHVIQTIESRKDKALVSKLALHVQPLSIWKEQEGTIHVYPSGDAYSCQPTQLASFANLRHNLSSSAVVTGSAFGGCQALQSFEKALPRYQSLMDADCPTILVLQALKQAGWRQHPSNSVVVHSPDNAMIPLCDSRGGVSQKFYYQCLLSGVRRCLELSSSMPSNAKQTYYKCLLLGRPVEASMSQKELLARLKDLPESAVLPIEDEDDAPLVPIAEAPSSGMGGEDGIVAGPCVHVTKSPTEAKATRAKQNGFLPLPEVSSLPVPAVMDGSVEASGGGQLGGVEPIVAAVVPVSTAAASSSSVVEPDGIIASGQAGIPDLVAPVESVGAPAAPIEVAAAANTGRKPRDWVPLYDNVGDICRDRYAPSIGIGYDNWLIRFDDSSGKREKKRLVTGSSTATFGELEPPAFLIAWRDGVLAGTIDEPRQKPSDVDIAHLVATRNAELQAIVQRFE